MSATTEPKIVCSGCHKQYKWKPELAGKKVRCKCGAVVAVPAQAAPPPEPADDDLYALADDPAPASSGPIPPIAPPIPPIVPPIPPIVSPIPPIAPPIPTPHQAMAGAAAMRAGGVSPVLGYAGRPSARQVERGSAWGIEGSPIKDFWVPIGCIAVGLIIRLIDWMVLNEVDFVWAMLAVAVGTIIEMVVLCIGCLIAMKLMDMALGAPLQALLKITAVALAPGAIGGIIGSSFDGGWMVGWGVSFLMYIFLLMAFFDLDGSEVMILASIIWVLKQAGGFLVMMVLVGWLLSGTPGLGALGGGSGGGGGMGGGGPNLRESAAEINAEIEESLREDPGQEARQWLAGSTRRTLYTLPRDQGVRLVDQLYAAGAVRVQAIGIVGELNTCTSLIVTLPEDKSSRKRLFDIEKRFLADRESDETDEDVGQKYIEFWFDD